MNPKNQQHAMQQAKALLIRKLPGKRSTHVKAQLNKTQIIIIAIWKRYQVGIYQLQFKHFRWYLDTQTQSMQPSTRYRYWLTIRSMVYALGKAEDWLPRLQGTWIRPDGNTGPLQSGRPAKVPSGF